MKLSTPFSLNTLQTQINKDSNHQLEAAPYGSDQNWFYIPFAAIADSSIKLHPLFIFEIFSISNNTSFKHNN